MNVQQTKIMAEALAILAVGLQAEADLYKQSIASGTKVQWIAWELWNDAARYLGDAALHLELSAEQDG